MRAAYQVHVVFLKEARYNVGAKCEGDTAVILAPPSDILVRVRPQEVAKQTTVGNLFRSDVSGSISPDVSIRATMP